MMEPTRAQAEITLGTTHFKEANEMIRSALESCDLLELRQVFAQRYIGCAMPKGKHMRVHGIPGNDMACFMDGGQIEVYGNAQDQIGNTMNDGLVIVHGRCGDAAGYAMRGGELFIRDDSGWRVGIHMKQYGDRRPTIVIGGNAGSFLGEYMAGGVILLLGNPGEYIGAGMHGGAIYLRNRLPDDLVAEGLVQERLDEEDIALASDLLRRYADYFGEEAACPAPEEAGRFFKLRPATSRPYASLYAS